ncbi:MAG: hypothetical protein K2Q01_11950 [Rickettsiales bacterium]|nr:hypothetical protein [Rickettsiales bacterium]
MAAEGTKIPNIASRLIEVMGADGKGSVKLAESVSSAVINIGAALGAAGVSTSPMAMAATIGALNVDPNLPNLAAGAGRQLA